MKFVFEPCVAMRACVCGWVPWSTMVNQAGSCMLRAVYSPKLAACRAAGAATVPPLSVVSSIDQRQHPYSTRRWPRKSKHMCCAHRRAPAMPPRNQTVCPPPPFFPIPRSKIDVFFCPRAACTGFFRFQAPSIIVLAGHTWPWKGPRAASFIFRRPQVTQERKRGRVELYSRACVDEMPACVQMK